MLSVQHTGSSWAHINMRTHREAATVGTQADKLQTGKQTHGFSTLFVIALTYSYTRQGGHVSPGTGPISLTLNLRWLSELSTPPVLGPFQ